MSDEEYAPLPFTPLIIIGAGRSGTNALRDALTRLQGFETWPCDEINPIWRHGNLDLPTDEIPPERATPAVRRAIRSSFFRIWQKQGCPKFIVEKTCANTLRVPFVDAVLPEALYIHIVRNGFDIIASARKRWRGELEVPGLSYYIAKARYAPLSDLPRYTVSAIKNRLAIRFGRQEHFDAWGPRFSELGSLAEAPLDEIVAKQWAACVASSDAAFAHIRATRVFDLRYEDFTQNPIDGLARITGWLGVAPSQTQLIEATSSIKASSVGKGLAVAEALPDNIRSVIAPVMRAHGYQD